MAYPQAPVQRTRDADDNPERPSIEALWLPQLVTDHRELRDGRMQDLFLQPGMAHQQHSHNGGQQQQGGKKRHERVIGDQRSQITSLIVDVFVDDRDEEAGDAAFPL